MLSRLRSMRSGVAIALGCAVAVLLLVLARTHSRTRPVSRTGEHIGPDFPAAPGSAVHIVQHAYKACLSLEREPERWEHFRDASAWVFPDMNRISAVDARNIDVLRDDRISVENKWRLLVAKTRNSHQEMTSAGAVGCTLSHVRAWEAFLASGATHLLVFEDDADVNNGTLDALASVNHFPSEGWDVWLLGGDVKKSSSIDEEWTRVLEFHHTHALLLTRGAVEKLSKYVLPIEAQIDGFMGYLAELGLLRVVWHARVWISYRFEGSGIANAWIVSELIKDLLLGPVLITVLVITALSVLYVSVFRRPTALGVAVTRTCERLIRGRAVPGDAHALPRYHA